MRQRRRFLNRANFANTLTASRPESPIPEPIKGPATRSRTKAQRTSQGATSQNKKNKGGIPTGFDSQGKPLFTRVSDGKLVYLECYVANCSRKSFATVEALRFHVSAPLGHHKIEGLFTGYDHAVELCGKVAPGQEDFNAYVDWQPTGVAPLANMLGLGLLSPTRTNSDAYDSDNGVHLGVAVQSSAMSDGQPSISSTTSRVEELGRAYRTSSVHRKSATEKRPRAQQAPDTFDGDFNSGFDSEKEGLITSPIALHGFGRHFAKNSRPTSTDHQFTGSELYEMCSEAGRQGERRGPPLLLDQATKIEPGDSPSMLLEQSPQAPSWSSITSRSQSTVREDQEVAAQADERDGEHGVTPKRKRAASDAPNTPLSLGKRPRLSAEPQSI